MTTPEPLWLHEEILLLALRDKEGTFASGGWHRHALGGAILAELLLAQRIRQNPADRKKRVEALSPKPLGEPLLDEGLERIRAARRPASLATWVERFAGWKELPHRIAARLCGRGILRGDERRILLLFRQRIYPEVNPEPERRLIDRLNRALFGPGANFEPRTLALVSLAYRAGLLRNTFDKRALRRQRTRIEALIEGEPAGRAINEAIQAAQAGAAVAASCGAAAVI
jgi:hypothetical protein